MKHVTQLSLLMAASVFLSGHAFAASSNNPEKQILGKWKIIDEKTSQPNGIVEVKQDKRTGLYYALPVKSLRKGRSVDMNCTKCPGKFKNKPIKSVPAIWNFKYDAKKKKFTNGYALDMVSGKVYHGEIKVTKNAKSLRLRGSPLGAKFIGRTNVWMRAE